MIDHSRRGLLCVVALVVSLFVLSEVKAQDADNMATRKAVAIEVVKKLQVTKSLDALLPNIATQQQGLIKKAFPTITQAQLDGVYVVLSRVMRREVAEFESLMADLYVRNFTLKQLGDLSAFFESETGKVLLDKQAELTAEGYQIGAKWGESLGNKIGPELDAYLKEKGL